MKIDESLREAIKTMILKAISKVEEKFVRWRVFRWAIGILILILVGMWRNQMVMTSDLRDTREDVAQIHGAIFTEVKDGVFTLDQKKNYQSSLRVPIDTPAKN